MSKFNEEQVAWSNALSCGIKLLDDQHKKLIKMMNEMFNHASGNIEQEREYFDNVVQEAVKYIKIHFATEEKIMLATKYSGYIAHKEIHRHFLLTLAQKIKDYRDEKPLTLSDFTKFIRDWLLSHITVMDKQYFEYFKKLASRKADGSLSINSQDVAIFM